MKKILGNLQSVLPSDEYEKNRLERESKKSAWEVKTKAEEENKRRANLWESSGIPHRHTIAYRDMPNAGPWAQELEKINKKQGEGFLCVLMGRRGTGKTQMSVCSIHNACENLRPSMYIKAQDLFISLRQAFRKDGDSEAEIIRQFTDPRFLVIDAMEERGETPFENRLLNHIIDKRYDNCDDTLLITNQTPEAFEDSAGPSIISRIHETGGKIVCDWDSFRKKV